MRAEQSRSVLYEVELPGGRRRWHAGSCQFISIENDLRGSLLLFHDVTDYVHTEQEHRRDAQYLNYLARYNAMGDMAMAIAHELAQPLAAATNFIAGTQSRLGDLADREDLTWGLDNARKQLDRANQIVRSLREYVTQLEESQQSVDLNEIVEECKHFIDIRAKDKQVRVTYELADEPLVIGCERVLTGQVVLNLCFNAIEEMANWPEQERLVQVRTARNGGRGEPRRDRPRKGPRAHSRRPHIRRRLHLQSQRTRHRPRAESPHHHPAGRHDRGHREPAARCGVRVHPAAGVKISRIPDLGRRG